MKKLASRASKFLRAKVLLSILLKASLSQGFQRETIHGKWILLNSSTVLKALLKHEPLVAFDPSSKLVSILIVNEQSVVLTSMFDPSNMPHSPKEDLLVLPS